MQEQKNFSTLSCLTSSHYAEAFLKCIREELPYFPTTGFRCEVLTDDPAVRKQVDDIFYDFFGEENPHQIEDYQNEPEQDMTFGGV